MLGRDLLQDMGKDWPEYYKRCSLFPSFAVHHDLMRCVSFRATASTVLSAVYDLPPIASSTDPVVEEINSLVASLVEAGAPGAYLVDTFHFLNYLPPWLAPWKREGMKRHENYTKMFANLFDGIGKRSVSSESCIGLETGSTQTNWFRRTPGNADPASALPSWITLNSAILNLSGCLAPFCEYCRIDILQNKLLIYFHV